MRIKSNPTIYGEFRNYGINILSNTPFLILLLLQLIHCQYGFFLYYIEANKKVGKHKVFSFS
jgi:hypothetical protein